MGGEGGGWARLEVEKVLGYVNSVLMLFLPFYGWWSLRRLSPEATGCFDVVPREN